MNRISPEILFANINTPKRIEIRSECDFYGASRLISDAIDGFRPEMLRGFWYHGWQYNPPEFLELYRWHKAPASWPLLVHRESEQLAMFKLGATSAKAIGAPILYCEDIKVSKFPNSLLIMPFHSLDYVTFEYAESDYFQCLDSVIGDFDVVAACIHPSCLSSGRWISDLRKRQIPYIIGAEAHDENGLRRMKQLLSRFTHVTSNWVGSHIAYAALCGAAPSIYGPRPFFKREEFEHDPYYLEHPHILEWWLSVENGNHVGREYGFLFREPHIADQCVNWARSQLGYENMLSHNEVASLLMCEEERDTRNSRRNDSAPSLITRSLQFCKTLLDAANKRHANK